MASLVQHEVLFAQLALSVPPPDEDTAALWYTVIKGYTDLSLFDDAYSSLIATPYEKQSVLFSVTFLRRLFPIENVNVLRNWCIACARGMP